MSPEHRQSSYDRLLDLIVEKVTSEEILRFSPTDDEQQRADDLRARVRSLTAEEGADLENLHRVETMASLLKAHALEIQIAKRQQTSSALQSLSQKTIEWLDALKARITGTLASQDKNRVSVLENLLYMVISDVKGPLHIIKGYAEILPEVSQLSEDGSKFAETIVSTCDEILRMVDRLTDLAKRSRVS